MLGFAESGQKMNIAAKTAGMSRRKRTLLPLLIILFLISYGMLTKLVIDQDRTIDSQRTLIHLLFKDNLHLSALKKAEGLSQAKASQGTSSNSLEAPSSKLPIIQTPLNQVPLNQVPSNNVSTSQVPSVKGPSTQELSEKDPLIQVPSGKTTAQNSAKTGRKSGKAQKAAPNRPPAELTDPSDMRRVWIAI
ncbi:MAG: hypothetical protein DMG95_13935 [Acidobacteria bacterium]|nr:MAG: hypothetical protein DMG95_13935 [Acidobacteriota bacterium]